MANLPVLWLMFNSLAPGKFEGNFKHVIFKQILAIDGWCICCEIALIWMSGLHWWSVNIGQVMAWCHQATSHYLSQCWPRSLSPCGVTRPQGVKFHLQLPHCIRMILISNLCGFQLRVFSYFINDNNEQILMPHDWIQNRFNFVLWSFCQADAHIMN